MKNLRYFFALMCFSHLAFSQVPKKVMVEHFTNTRCSFCASRNPGFYTNYNGQSGALHLAIHPSSPYSSCLLSQHNPSENDGRTNYYGIYGSTPRLVIQGAVIPASANYASASIFSPYLGQTSPASIKIKQYKFGNDSIRSRIVIKTEALHNLGALRLFVALAEDTLNYTGPNGEPQHYDVFRKSLTGTSGISVTLPANIGDSVVYIKSSPANSAWNFSRLFTLAVLQETASKTVIQAESVPASTNNLITNIREIQVLGSAITVYAAQKKLYVNQTSSVKNLTLTIYDVNGKEIAKRSIESATSETDLSSFDSGIYFYRISSSQEYIKSGKFTLE